MKTTIPDSMLNDPAVQRATQPHAMNTIKDAKTALAGHTPSTEAVNVINEAARLLREELINIPALGQAAFCRAYSVWLIEDVAYPDYELFGISEELAEVLRRQCRAIHHRQLDAQRPAVTFTEAEARQAAEDLRLIAADLCERGDGDNEKILRLLAQKFDTWRRDQ